MPRLSEGCYDTGLSRRAKPRQLFERHAIRVASRSYHRSALGTQRQPGQHLAQCAQSPVPIEECRLRGLPRRRRSAGSAARPASERLRPRHECGSRSDSRPVPQLPADRSPLSSRAHSVRPRHRRGGDVPRFGRRGRRRRARALRQWPNPSRQRLRHDRRGRLAPRLHRQRALLQHHRLQHLGLHQRCRRRACAHVALDRRSREALSRGSGADAAGDAVRGQARVHARTRNGGADRLARQIVEGRAVGAAVRRALEAVSERPRRAQLRSARAVRSTPLSVSRYAGAARNA